MAMSDPQVQEAIRQIRERLDADPGLIERGRLVDTTMILAVGEDEWRFRIVEGRITALDAGPFVTPSYAFRIWAPREEWLRFWQPVPPPGSHDLFALLKRRVLRLEGDLHPLIANL
ncbi:MAG: hypothetical protein VW339_10520, partial [Quisquiliibacterium sp.]